MPTDSQLTLAVPPRQPVRPSLLALTVGGTTVVASYWLGWDVGALLAAEALTGIGLALADGEPDDDISAI